MAVMDPVGTAVGKSSTGTSDTLTKTGCTSGNKLVLLISTPDGASRTLTPTTTSGSTGTWAALEDVEHSAGGRRKAIWHADVTGSGDVTVTVTANFSHAWGMALAEIPPATPAAHDNEEETSNSSTHVGAPSGSIDVAANAIVFIAGSVHIANYDNTPPTSWTRIAGLFGAYEYYLMFAYRALDAGFTDEQGTWTSGEARVGGTVIASFVSSGSPASTFVPQVIMVL